MQVPILRGVYTDEAGDFRTAMPVNMMPVAMASGISAGYLHPAVGIVRNGAGPGVTRGGINWRGVCYRVMGTKFVSIDAAGTVTIIADVGGTGHVTFDYSFDYLGIASSGNLYMYNGATVAQVTDPDLLTVVDFLWIDGYFMTTDGTFLIVTELANPFDVNPLKYGASELDPDPVVALLKVRDEVYALNRYTIELFDNVGGDNFPFQRIDGAQIQKGVIGTHACCEFQDAVAFLGSGRNEAPGIYIGTAAQAQKISTAEVDTVLLQFTEAELALVVMEARVDRDHIQLLIHLPDRTLVYDAGVSQALGEPIWFALTSSVVGWSRYRARDLVWCYDRWLVGDANSALIAYLDNALSSHFGDVVRWEFSTSIVYNESRGAIFQMLELVCLTGRVAFGAQPVISTSYSVDGETWSQEKTLQMGTRGDRNKRLTWWRQGAMRNWRIQRFRGDSQAFLSVARLEATLEPLGV